MSIPDPLAFLEGGILHKIDIAIAEAFTGHRGRTVSRHAVDPAVRAGVPVATAIAALHVVLVAGGAAVALYAFSTRRR